MWNAPSKERLSKIPGLYETEHIKPADKLIHLHCFIGACDWFVAEYDGGDLFWGFAILNQDYEMAEWGYISLSELKSLKAGWVEVDFDLHWKVRPANEVPDIRKAMRWDVADRQEKELFAEMKKMTPIGQSEA